MTLKSILTELLSESEELVIDEQLISNSAVYKLLDRLYAKLSEDKYKAYTEGYEDGQSALAANISAMLKFYESN